MHPDWQTVGVFFITREVRLLTDQSIDNFEEIWTVRSSFKTILKRFFEVFSSDYSVDFPDRCQSLADVPQDRGDYAANLSQGLGYIGCNDYLSEQNVVPRSGVLALGNASGWCRSILEIQWLPVCWQTESWFILPRLYRWGQISWGDRPSLLAITCSNRRDRCRVRAWETAEGPTSSSFAMLAKVHPCFRRAALMSSTCIEFS